MLLLLLLLQLMLLFCMLMLPLLLLQGGQFREVEREPFPQRFSGRAQANGQPHALKAQLRGKQGCKREPAEVEHEARN